SLKGKSTTGLTIWMPALLTSTSTRPYSAITAATPALTACSSTTFMATANALPPLPLISDALCLAASRLRSAIAAMPPSAAKRRAISLPMPLAAPVMIATFPSNRAILEFLSSAEVVVKQPPEGEREVDQLMAPTRNSSHGKIRDTAIHVGNQMKPCLAFPGAVDRYVFEIVADELRDLWRSINVGNQFQVDLKFSYP